MTGGSGPLHPAAIRHVPAGHSAGPGTNPSSTSTPLLAWWLEANANANASASSTVVFREREAQSYITTVRRLIN